MRIALISFLYSISLVSGQGGGLLSFDLNLDRSEKSLQATEGHLTG